MDEDERPQSSHSAQNGSSRRSSSSRPSAAVEISTPRIASLVIASRSWPAALIGSGTCRGGCIKELALRHGQEKYPRLVPGDEVRLSVEHLGEIVAPVRAAVRPPWPGYRSTPAPTAV